MKTDRFFLAEWYRSKRGTAARSHASKVEQALQSWPGEASPFQCGSRVTSRNVAARPTRSHAMHISRSFPLSWFGTPDGTRLFFFNKATFFVYSCSNSHAITPDGWKQKHISSFSYVCTCRTKIILSLMKLRHLHGQLQRRAYYFLKSSTWFSGFRKFCRQLGPTAVEWYNGLHCTRKTAERDRSRVTKVVYQTF